MLIGSIRIIDNTHDSVLRLIFGVIDFEKAIESSSSGTITTIGHNV